MCAGEYTRKKLCHNCDTKPAFAAQTDFFDRSHLLILRKLLKTQMCSKIPAYRLARHLSLTSVQTCKAFLEALSRIGIPNLNQMLVRALVCPGALAGACKLLSAGFRVSSGLTLG
jgi:hypothetical protein